MDSSEEKCADQKRPANRRHGIVMSMVIGMGQVGSRQELSLRSSPCRSPPSSDLKCSAAGLAAGLVAALLALPLAAFQRP